MFAPIIYYSNCWHSARANKTNVQIVVNNNRKLAIKLGNKNESAYVHLHFFQMATLPLSSPSRATPPLCPATSPRPETMSKSTLSSGTDRTKASPSTGKRPLILSFARSCDHTLTGKKTYRSTGINATHVYQPFATC